MGTYQDYLETFCGELKEAEFFKSLPKAQAYLKAATHGRTLSSDTNVRFCLYELIELFAKEVAEPVSHESVDGFSVSYDDSAIRRALWRTVSVYLSPEGVLYGGGDT